MAIDLTKTGFKYTVNADGTVSYTALCDGKVQKLSGHNIASKDALELDLAEYTTAYMSGLATQAVDIGDGITVGVQATADAVAVIEAATPPDPTPTPDPAPEV